MSYAFVLVILMRGYNTFNTSAVQVGPFYTANSCLEAKDFAMQRKLVVDAFCVKVDRSDKQ
jgi:hypothetical protein